MILNKINTKNTIIVNEGDYAISNNNNLYTTGLYSCVALYAITKDFNFLAHILVQNKSSEFILTGVDKINKLYDYLSEIENKDEEIYLGIAYGIWQDPELLPEYETISAELDERIDMLISEGFNIERLEDAQSEFLFIDFEAKEIIFEDDSINLEGSWNYNVGRSI